MIKIIVGPQGSGKSSTAAEIAKFFGAADVYRLNALLSKISAQKASLSKLIIIEEIASFREMNSWIDIIKLHNIEWNDPNWILISSVVTEDEATQIEMCEELEVEVIALSLG